MYAHCNKHFFARALAHINEDGEPAQGAPISWDHIKGKMATMANRKMAPGWPNMPCLG